MRRPWSSLNPQTLAKGFVDRPDYGDNPEEDEMPMNMSNERAANLIQDILDRATTSDWTSFAEDEALRRAVAVLREED